MIVFSKGSGGSGSPHMGGTGMMPFDGGGTIGSLFAKGSGGSGAPVTCLGGGSTR